MDGARQRTAVYRLNLGCGLQIIPGYENLDGSPNVLLSRVPVLKQILFSLGLLKQPHMASFPRQIVWTQLPAGLKRYPDGSADRVYTSHFIEHLSAVRAERTLKEIYRILCPLGILRLVVPDTFYYASRYIDAVHEMEASGSCGTEPRDRLMQHIAGGYFPPGTGHRVAWDWPSAEFALRAVGFQRITRHTFRVGADLEMAAADNRPNDSLYIEAIR